MRIEAIETFYKGDRFRSRLEARYAVFFDTLGIKYSYEPEGYKLGGVINSHYLPDFYMPELNCFFEVKGLMTEDDMGKILKFASAIVGDHKHIFVGGPYFEKDMIMTPSWVPVPFKDEFAWHLEDAGILTCERCGATFFADLGQFEYNCPICNLEIDYGYMLTRWSSDEQWEQSKIYPAILKAKQARFEHGETP